MRPRSFDRGNISGGRNTWRTSLRFNEAAIFRPRKWRYRHGVVSFRQCFNEAAIFRPRKFMGGELLTVRDARLQ